MVISRKRTALIGKILVELGKITKEQLAEALLLQKEKYPNENLGKILISVGFITEDEIYTALALQYAYPYISIGRYKFNEEIFDVIPKEIAYKYKVVPLDKFRNIMTVAMLNPLNREAIEQVEEITGLSVRVFVTSSQEINDALELIYKG